MYKPTFNTILVEIVVDKWAPGNDDSMLGRSYREGRIVADQVIKLLPTKDYPLNDNEKEIVADEYESFIGKDIMWNEGTEAGTTFEEDGKLYGFIYWWDVRGLKTDAK